MSYEGLKEGMEILKKGGACGDAAEHAVKLTEDYPFYKSVGYGGLPNENCEVELDAAFMDGDTLSIGAVAGVKDFANPVSIARKLSEDRFNIFLVGAGAEAYASLNGFERKNMLTERAKKIWEMRLKEIREKNLSPYDGHDTVCVLARDMKGSLCVANSTSGLFMKKRGRVGDSPISGSGFYADSEYGCAAATGLGEDIMKGCLSYEVVSLMKNGVHPKEAAQTVVNNFSKRLEKLRGKAGAISIIAIDKNGEWGIGTNCEFSFAVGTENSESKIYIANIENEKLVINEATQEWLENYTKRITKPLEEM
ncbi:MAG: N(4)-(beta-N-acetylglucosaminyl)-L-asparaginase [Fusobacteriaceae bacterium]